MNIYILKIKPEFSRYWSGINESFIIRAENKKEARKIANQNISSEDEISKDVWLYPKFSTCKILRRQGNKEVIMFTFKD